MWDAEDLAAGPHQGTFATAFADGHGRPARTVERIRISGVMQEREMLREYLPTGEIRRITQRAPGAPDAVRWMRYDSLGRLVLNAEPNTSTGFTASPSQDPATLKAWRYAYNDAGDLVGTSDARGCGVNYHFEAAGRVIAEDYSPCEPGHAPYTPVTDLSTGAGTEAFFRYDISDPEAPNVLDDAGTTLPIDPVLLLGRAVSVADRGSKGLVRYDALGRVTGTAVRVAQPGGADPSSPASYAPRWYVQQKTFDAADRPVTLTSGATVTELLGSGGQSLTTASYSQRGSLVGIGSSYGTLLASQTFAATGQATRSTLGDLAGTQRAYSYDQNRRMRSVQTYRAGPELWTSPTYTPATDATQQLLLEDYDFTYDQVGNITEIKDWRPAEDWPGGAKPVSRRFDHDDLYRLTRVRYDHAAGADTWTSPFAAENDDPTRTPRPGPHVAFSGRVKEQRYSYDHLGNTTRTTDDASGFFDRSLGNIQHGPPTSGPHQLASASNRTLASSSPRKGDLAAEYDPAGNLTGLTLSRDGDCLPAGASCWQRFAYAWDELGRLVEARRFDLSVAERSTNASLTSPLPARPPDAHLRYVYDASGQRVLKTAIDASNNESHTVYIFSTLELRRTWWTSTAPGSPNDYALTPQTQYVSLPAGAARARIIYSEEDLPTQSSGHQHVFLELSDHLGSGTFIIDRATSELVEHSTYMAYGAVDSDYRPGRWGSFREPYKFGGKEEDVEVGLQYFGARYLVVGLGRWASADPATIHALRSDPNPYSYVGGRPMVAIDPDGREAITLGVIVTAVVIGAAVGATAATASYLLNNDVKPNSARWRKGLGISAGFGAIAGGVAGGATMGAGALVGVQVGANAAMPTLGQAFVMGAAGGAANSATSAALYGGSGSEIAKAAGMGAALGAGFATLGAFAGAMASAPTSAASEGSVLEALATAVGQAGAAYGYQKATGASDAYATYAATSAGVNGAFAGARGVYDWDNPSGPLAAGLDATWGITGTTLGNAANLVNVTGAWGAQYKPELSQRQNQTVYSGGVKVPGSVMTTFGNVVSGGPSLITPDVSSHEGVHVWHSRTLGDRYWMGYGTWLVGGTIAGALSAPFAGESVSGTADLFGYWNNPFEVHARRSERPRNPSTVKSGAW